ncbi:MAG: YigZ family protein [Ignavibacteriaceae bacterium]|nr:YigZ family protein [Ignavibacteriaceae bacterium]
MIINYKCFALYHFSDMNLPDEIRTIDEFGEVTTTIKKSNFIAQVYSINSEDEFKLQLTKTKKKYYDASHHCYAYKLASGNVRYSDAGEPNGTAGIRILNAIEHFSLVNQLVIVSRIFGGIKLGTGPLGKAYYQSAFEVLNDSQISTKHLYKKVKILSEIDQISLIYRILANHKSIVIDSEYQEKFSLSCFITSTEIESVSQKLDLGKNKISITIQPEVVYK